MTDYRNKLDSFHKALERLLEGIQLYTGKDGGVDDLIRDGVIQRFEFTFELAWKTIKAIFEAEGLKGLNSPKTVLREAYSAGLIDDEELWLSILKDRNETVHLYDKLTAIRICNNIKHKYAAEFEKLEKKLMSRVIRENRAPGS